MNGILKRIVDKKIERIAQAKACVSPSELTEMIATAPSPKNFESPLRGPGINIIAEIKRASPSKGSLAENLNPCVTALSYKQGGAAAISVITEEDHFMGSEDDLKAVRAVVDLPILRKDFILDTYQILETRAWGADSYLLITSLLGGEKLEELVGFGRDLGMEPLVETHTVQDVYAAWSSGAKIIGVNNRNLNDFTVDLNATYQALRITSADHTVVSESGIKTHGDIMALQGAGVAAFLIGETLVRSSNPCEKLNQLKGKCAANHLPESIAYENQNMRHYQYR